MLSLKTAYSWSLAGLAALTVLAAPLAEAGACDPDPCASSDRFGAFAITHEQVATDGVLVFEGRRGEAGALTDAEAAAYVSIRVSDADGDGSELTGALEAVDGLYVWRPDEALPAGIALAVDVEIDNASIDEVECGIEPLDPTLMVSDGPLPTFELPELVIETSYEFRRDYDYPSLVCCDGAYPSDSVDSCGGVSPHVGAEGYCAYQDGVGFMRAQLGFGDELAPEVAASIRWEFVADGEVVASRPGSLSTGALDITLDHAFELEVHAVSLIDGTDVSSDPYPIDGGPDTLGQHTRDIQADLEANCETPAYVCEVGPTGEGRLQGWDSEACEPFVPDEGESDSDGETDGGSDSDGETDGASESDGETDGDSDSDGETDGTSESDTDDSDSSGADDDAGGCSCQADQPSGGIGWMALLGLGVFWRRRRTSRDRVSA